MRYAVLIPDGAADLPRPELDGRTVLEAANLPHFDRVAAEGRLGLARTVPDGMAPGSDVANLSVLGYDPAKVYTGRAPLEAASLGITLREDEAVFRANTVTVRDGIMEDYAGGHIGTDEARTLIRELDARLNVEGVRLVPGVSYRHACVIAHMAGAIPDRAPPHDILGKHASHYPPMGSLAAKLERIEARTRELIPDTAVGRARAERGAPPVTQLWLWGGGVMPSLPRFQDMYRVDGGLISAVDLLKGIGILAGLEIIEVPGATGFYDTNYAGKGEAALECLGRKKLVIVHVEAPDEAGHNGETDEKVRALERIDQDILAPLLREADRAGDLRILCMPDHPTPIEIRTHTDTPVPYALWGPGIDATGGHHFTETAAAALSAPALPANLLMGMLVR